MGAYLVSVHLGYGDAAAQTQIAFRPSGGLHVKPTMGMRWYRHTLEGNKTARAPQLPLPDQSTQMYQKEKTVS